VSLNVMLLQCQGKL